MSDDALAHRFSHVHVYASDPTATVSWLTAGLGGEVVNERALGSATNTYVRIGGQYVTVRGPRDGEVFNEPRRQSSGVDHFGLSVPDLAKALDELRRRNLVPETVFRDGTSDVPVAVFFVGPDGMTVELTSHQTFADQFAPPE